MEPRARRPQAAAQARRPYGATPRHRADEGVNTMRLGGFVMLALAAWHLIERFVLSFWLDLDTSLGKTMGFATFDALLGVAMLQGSEVARKVVLFITGLATVAFVVGIVSLVLGGFGHLWPLLGTSALAALGIFLLVLSREPGLPLLVSSLGLVGIGWLGSVLSSIFLVGTLDLSTINLLREWGSPDRTFESPETGLGMKVPTRWVVMKEGHPIGFQDRTALLTLANTEVICFAQLFSETRTYSSADSVEYYLDQLAKPKQSEPEFAHLGRSDGTVDGTPARRIKTAWRHEKTLIHQYFTAWQDGDVFYHLSLWGPGILAKKLEAELDTLEKGLSFSAPWAVFLKDKAGPIQKACPLLSEKATILLARTISKDSPPEAYCREGYRLAFRGQPLLDKEAGHRLQAVMRAFFNAVPRGQIGRFGSYVERLRVDQKTSPAEDREMTGLARAAVDGLDQQAQEGLRAYFGMAIELGGFGPRF